MYFSAESSVLSHIPVIKHELKNRGSLCHYIIKKGLANT